MFKHLPYEIKLKILLIPKIYEIKNILHSNLIDDYIRKKIAYKVIRKYLGDCRHLKLLSYIDPSKSNKLDNILSKLNSKQYNFLNNKSIIAPSYYIDLTNWKSRIIYNNTKTVEVPKGGDIFSHIIIKANCIKKISLYIGGMYYNTTYYLNAKLIKYKPFEIKGTGFILSGQYMHIVIYAKDIEYIYGKFYYLKNDDRISIINNYREIDIGYNIMRYIQPMYGLAYNNAYAYYIREIKDN